MLRDFPKEVHSILMPDHDLPLTREYARSLYIVLTLLVIAFKHKPGKLRREGMFGHGSDYLAIFPGECSGTWVYPCRKSLFDNDDQLLSLLAVMSSHGAMFRGT